MEIRELNTGNIEEIKFIIKETFSKEPFVPFVTLMEFDVPFESDIIMFKPGK